MNRPSARRFARTTAFRTLSFALTIASFCGAGLADAAPAKPSVPAAPARPGKATKSAEALLEAAESKLMSDPVAAVDDLNQVGVLLESDPRRRASTLADLASDYLAIGAVGAAKKYFDLALTTANGEASSEEKKLLIGLIQGNLGDVAYREGNYVEAKKLLETSLASGRTRSRVCLGATLLALGDAAKAREVVAPLAKPDSCDDASDGDCYEAKSVLALACTELGDAACASRMLVAAEDARQLFTAGDYKQKSSTSEALTKIGESNGAARRVIVLSEVTIQGRFPLKYAVIVGNFAAAFHARGDFGRALQLFQAALGFDEKFGSDADRAADLNDIAAVLTESGQAREALAYADRALALVEKSLGPDRFEVAAALHNVATIHTELGDLSRAEQLLSRAQTIAEKIGPSDRNTPIILHGRALLRRVAGQSDEARTLEERALALRMKRLGPNHPLVARAWSNLGAVELGAKRWGAAEANYEQACKVHAIALPQILRYASADEKARYLASIRRETDQIVSLAVLYAQGDKRASALAAETAIARKGRSIDSVWIDSAIEKVQPGERDLRAKLADARTKLARSLLGDSSDPNGAQSIQRDVDALEAALSSRSSASTNHTTLANVRDALPKDAALVELVVYSPFSPMGKTSSERWGADRVAALVIHKEGDVFSIDLGESKAIDDASSRFRESLSDPRRDDVKSLARKLDALTLDRLRPLIGNARRIFVAPDGSLSLIPWAALVDSNGSYEGEKYILSYLTTGRDLVASPRAARLSPPMVIAAPSFGEKKSRADLFAGVTFSPLPGTQREASGLSALFEDARALVGDGATKDALAQSNVPRFLHIATHGFFLDAEPSAANTGDSERGLILDRRTRAAPSSSTTATALSRSGLALAGANASSESILTALEVMNLPLQGTKLAVLSACETGLGKVERGEGVYGLRRALVLAGTESQVMSLWKVDDDATAKLMLRFYSLLKNGGGRASSLRTAQRELAAVKATAHPYYWASFIPSGRWENLDGIDVDESPSNRSNLGNNADGSPSRVRPPPACGCDVVGSDSSSPSALTAAALLALLSSFARARRPRTESARRRSSQ